MHDRNPEEPTRVSPASAWCDKTSFSPHCPDDERPRVTVAWKVTGGDVEMPVGEAEWWGASLSVLQSAVHHPLVLAAQQPDTDPASVAWAVVEEMPELHRAAEVAAAQRVDDEGLRFSARVRRRGNDVVISPGAEVSDLALVLEVFVNAVLDPTGDKARIARGALAYSASAWSHEIGLASGALPAREPELELPSIDGLGL